MYVSRTMILCGTIIPVLKWVQLMHFRTTMRLTPHSTTLLLPCCPLSLLCLSDVELADKIAYFTVINLLVKDATDAMSKHTSLFPHAACMDWTFLDSALYFKGHFYIPEPVCQNLVYSFHCSPVGGHGSYFRTVHLVQRNYWWPGLTTFVHQFVAGCTTCQANKVNTHLTVPRLCPILSSASHLCQQISYDMVTNLPVSFSFDSVLAMIDHGLTKGVIFITCTKSINATSIAALFFKHIFTCFDLHDKVISDCSAQFTSAFAKELARLLSYDVTLSTTYHPQIKGRSEWINQELETYLKILCQDKPTLLPTRPSSLSW